MALPSILSQANIIWGGTANPAAQNVTVPSGCSHAILFWQRYAGSGAFTPSATLAGVAAAQTEISPTGDDTRTGTLVWDAPAAGTASLDPNFGLAEVNPGAGNDTTCTVVFIADGGDRANWKFNELSSGASAGATRSFALTGLTAGATLVIQYDTRSGTPAPGTPAGWTSVTTQGLGASGARLSSITAAGTSQTCASQATLNWSTLAAVAIPEAAGGAVTLTVVDALHAHTADNVGLTQANTLAVADATHAHAADAPTTSVAFSLTVAEGLHSHTADSPSLTQANSLAAAEALHAHSADSPTLTQANTIAPAEALHSHAADNLDLVIAGVLGPADALHGHTADSPALVQANTLSAQEAAHGHSADNVTLSQAIILTVAEALHAHGVDSPTLTQAAALIVADSMHAHGVDSLVLTQAHVLAVQDALHAHLSDTVFMGDLVGYLTGTLTVRPALTGSLTVSPALSGTLTIEPS